MTQSRMRISLLSPVFNESAHIGEMLNSAADQTHQNFELICVDDGSTDDTAEIVHRFSQNDPRIKLISEGKLGKVQAFNRAFRAARGDIIVLMGGDDILPPDSLERRAAAISSQWKSADSKVAAFAHLRTFSKDPRFDGQRIPRSPNRGSRSGGALAISRPLAECLFPVPDNLISEDLWLGNGAEAAAESIVEIESVVLHYRIHAGNSNPRNQPFNLLNESMHRRMLAYSVLAQQSQFDMPRLKRAEFAALGELEDLRYAGKLLHILLHRSAALTDRLRALSMANPHIYAVRRHFFKLLSGR